MEKNKIKNGGKNLALLGLISILIAFFSVGTSLIIYHNTGDIYLDRSRPGFLPDKTEVQDEQKSEYKFTDDTKIDQSKIDKFLEEYKKIIDQLQKKETNFSEEAIDDKTLFGE